MRRRHYVAAAAATLLLVGSVAIAAKLKTRALGSAVSEGADPSAVSPVHESRWGADYFPNVVLTTHEGKKVRFFDDLIKDKVVVINFIYTSCPDSCPLETARLAQVEEILGERVGRDVFFYSITIDPETDTPEVLAQYRKRYDAGSGWTFLTGKEADIVKLRKKLGLYLQEIQKEGSNNHNLSLIVGNQKTGRWMKRSPFENPHVLAKQVGSWLHDWKEPAKNDYKDAPKLRGVSDGERLFRTRCAACHTIGGTTPGGALPTDKKSMGPDLMGVLERRERKWLMRWILQPDKMLAEKDPIATALFEQYDRVAMPNMRLTPTDVDGLLEFLKTESEQLKKRRAPEQSRDGLVIKNAWIRESPPGAKINAGYLTLVNERRNDDALVKLSSPSFAKVELHEMTMTNGMKRMRPLPKLRVPAGSEARLEPGGKHLMLIGSKKPIGPGEQVKIKLEFESGKQWTISVPVST